MLLPPLPPATPRPGRCLSPEVWPLFVLLCLRPPDEPDSPVSPLPVRGLGAVGFRAIFGRSGSLLMLVGSGITLPALGFEKKRFISSSRITASAGLVVLALMVSLTHVPTA